MGCLILGHLEFQIGSGFEFSILISSQVSGQVALILSCLISCILRFQVVRVWIGSDFGLSDLELSWVLDRSSLGQFDFLKKIKSGWVRIRGVSQVGSDFVTYNIMTYINKSTVGNEPSRAWPNSCSVH
jgi:hypothetical protein